MMYLLPQKLLVFSSIASYCSLPHSDIFLSCFILGCVICIAGFLYNYKVLGRRGQDALPGIGVLRAAEEKVYLSYSTSCSSLLFSIAPHAIPIVQRALQRETKRQPLSCLTRATARFLPRPRSFYVLSLAIYRT